jgi:replicative DNA helicase
MNVMEPQVSSLPANVDAERSILGAILLDSKAYDEAATLDLVAEDFSLDSNRKIYRCIEELAHKGAAIDLITLTSLLSEGMNSLVSGTLDTLAAWLKVYRIGRASRATCGS